MEVATCAVELANAGTDGFELATVVARANIRLVMMRIVGAGVDGDADEDEDEEGSCRTATTGRVADVAQ